MRRAARIFCVVLPVLGIFLALGTWIVGKSERADELLFFCFVGIFFNILVVVPIGIVISLVGG